MNEYLIIIEKTSNGYSSYSPDIDGYIAVGDTKEECEQNMRSAMMFHLELMLEKGYDIPKPKNREVEFIKINYNQNRKHRFAMA